MKELIRIVETDKGSVVSAKELRAYLQVKTDLVIWCKRMFEYGFEEGRDYTAIKSENPVNQQVGIIDYALTVETAKEISMLQRTVKGKEAREYFLECEKRARNPLANISKKEALRMALAAEEEKELLQLEVSKKEEIIKENAPKVVFADSVMGSSNSILVREFAKLISNDGFKIGQNRLFEWMRENKYLNKKNEPYQNFVERGYFEVIERTIGSGHETFTSKTTKITGAGQVYFAKKIRNNEDLAA